MHTIKMSPVIAIHLTAQPFTQGLRNAAAFTSSWRLRISDGHCALIHDSTATISASLSDFSYAGIAESYEPEALVGKSIVIVANLAPRKMMGLESQGMVLAASPDGGQAFVLNSEPAPPGTRVR